VTNVPRRSDLIWLVLTGVLVVLGVVATVERFRPHLGGETDAWLWAERRLGLGDMVGFNVWELWLTGHAGRGRDRSLRSGVGVLEVSSVEVVMDGGEVSIEMLLVATRGGAGSGSAPRGMGCRNRCWSLGKYCLGSEGTGRPTVGSCPASAR
jgi:hypothetical protein